MLDKNSLAILVCLNEKAGTNFTILSKKEIISALPSKTPLDDATFSSLVNFLKQQQYITVKYEDGQDICVAVTQKAIAYLEHSKNSVEKAELTKKQSFLFAVYSLIGAFVGAFIATVIANLIF